MRTSERQNPQRTGEPRSRKREREWNPHKEKRIVISTLLVTRILTYAQTRYYLQTPHHLPLLHIHPKNLRIPKITPPTTLAHSSSHCTASRITIATSKVRNAMATPLAASSALSLQLPSCSIAPAQSPFSGRRSRVSLVKVGPSSTGSIAEEEKVVTSSGTEGADATTPEASTSQPARAFSPTACQACGKEERVGGCNGEGRILGGLSSVPGFGWFPIKAYRPCPAFVEAGGRYKRQGQSLEEVAFGRTSKQDNLDITERLQGGKKK